MFMPVLRNILCTHSSILIRDSLQTQDRKLSLLGGHWGHAGPVCAESPRLMLVEHRNASQDSSLDIVSANLFQQEYWLESIAAVPPAPVSITRWMIRDHHMQILSFKTFYRQISQRFRLTESELYICFYIIPNTSVAKQSITPLSWKEQVFCISQLSGKWCQMRARSVNSDRVRDNEIGCVVTEVWPERQRWYLYLDPQSIELYTFCWQLHTLIDLSYRHV